MVQEMAKQPKAKAEAYGQKKTERFQVLFTAEGLERLDGLASRLNLSRSDLLEKMTRALYSMQDDAIIISFLEQKEEITSNQNLGKKD